MVLLQGLVSSLSNPSEQSGGGLRPPAKGCSRLLKIAESVMDATISHNVPSCTCFLIDFCKAHEDAVLGRSAPLYETDQFIVHACRSNDQEQSFEM